jgi:hypothetical protein
MFDILRDMSFILMGLIGILIEINRWLYLLNETYLLSDNI